VSIQINHVDQIATITKTQFPKVVRNNVIYIKNNMGNKKQSDRKKKKERKKDVLIGALMTQNIQLIDKNKEMKKKKLKSRVRRGNENIKSPDGECKNEDEGIRGTIECKQRREEVNGAKKPRIK